MLKYYIFPTFETKKKFLAKYDIIYVPCKPLLSDILPEGSRKNCIF